MPIPTRTIVAAILIAGSAGTAQAQTAHMLASSQTGQTRINAQWDRSHPAFAVDNQHIVVADRDRTPGSRLSCGFSREERTRVVTMSNCHLTSR